MTTKININHELPKEWEELVVLAMESNVTKEEFKEFIEKKSSKKIEKHNQKPTE
ncbi:anti-repressor SinI family protein [Priestia aryabhattai]